MKRTFKITALLFAAAAVFFFTACGGGKTPEGPKQELSGVNNVIIMIGDGMGPVHEDAGRDAKGAPLSWDGFEHAAKVYTGSLNTAQFSYPVPTDSAAAATALATGKKASNGVIAKSIFGDDLETILDIAKTKNKATGVITSDLLSGATPAAFSGHADGRGLEADIVSSQAVSGVDLLMGASTAAYGTARAAFEYNGYTYNTSLNAAKGAEGKLIGVFPGVTPSGAGTAETLQDMTVFALDYLSRNEGGFTLMIEGAKIDTASHSNDLVSMLAEFAAFDECVQIVRDWAEENKDALVIVTADHETGGLEFSGGKYVFTAGNSHTVTDVNCYMAGWPYDNPPFDGFTVGGHIDNTDIFKLMSLALGVNG